MALAGDFYGEIDLHQNQIKNGKFEKLPAPPTNPETSRFYFDTTENHFYGWNGLEWVNFGTLDEHLLAIQEAKADTLEALATVLTKTSEASASAVSALASKNASKISEDNAKLSETNSKTSETNSKASEVASKTSETNSKTSETNASTTLETFRDEIVEYVRLSPDTLLIDNGFTPTFGSAAQTGIDDVANHYSSSNVEGALQEVGTKFTDVSQQLAEKATQTDLNIANIRMDTFVAVSSTTDNAETADIRIGADGIMRASAGAAIRNTSNKVFDFDNNLWSSGNVVVTKTTGAWQRETIANAELVVGQEYKFSIESIFGAIDALWVEVKFYDSTNTRTTLTPFNITSSSEKTLVFTIPNNTVRTDFAFFVNGATTISVSTTAIFSGISLMKSGGADKLKLECLPDHIHTVNDVTSYPGAFNKTKLDYFSFTLAFYSGGVLTNSTTRALSNEMIDGGQIINIINKNTNYSFIIIKLNATTEEYISDFTTGWQVSANFARFLPAGYKYQILYRKNDNGVLDLSVVNAMLSYDLDFENDDSVQIDRYYNLHTPISVAHQGYNKTAPNNTEPAVVAARKKGFSHIETDIAWTSDGVPVCSHYGTVYADGLNVHHDAIEPFETYTTPIIIANTSLASLQTYDFGYWKNPIYAGTKILTFDRCVYLCKLNGLTVHVDHVATATNDQLEALYGVLLKYGMVEQSFWNSGIVGWEHSVADFLVAKGANFKIEMTYTAPPTQEQITYLNQFMTTNKNCTVYVALPYDSYTTGQFLAIKTTHSIFDNLKYAIWTIDNMDIYDDYAPYAEMITSNLYHYRDYARIMATYL